MGITKLKQFKDYNIANQADNLHKEITPAEVRIGDNISAKIMYDKAGLSIKEDLRVWRLSPLGIELVKNNDTPNFVFGDKLNISISVGEKTSEIKGVIIETTYKEGNTEIIGIRLTPNKEMEKPDIERRANKRWWTNSEFMPTGTFPNPGRFNDFVYFTISDLSAKGMKIRTSLRNKFLVKGMELTATISFPMVSTTPIRFKIISADTRLIDHQSFLVLGCEFSESENIQSILGDYIFQFGPPTSIAELRKEGLNISSSLSSVEFNYVRTEEDYKQVINLRRTAYSLEGKSSGSTDTFADIYDSRSRIIMAKYKGEVIASCRLIFNEFGDEPEHGQFINFPNNFPRIDEFVEITRVCTHPDYRKSDLLMGLFQFAAKTVVQSGRRYVIGCSTQKLMPIYTKLGFKDTKITFNHADLNNLEHQLISADVHKIANGVGVNPIVWNIVWSDLVDYLISSNNLKNAEVSKVRIGYYKLFKPISKVLLRKPRKKK